MKGRKKVKKKILVLAGIALLMALVPTTVVLAAPPNPPDYGKVDPTNISQYDEFLPQILKIWKRKCVKRWLQEF